MPFKNIDSPQPIPSTINDKGDWALTHTTSSVECHGVAHLNNKRIAPLILAVDHKSDRIIATHINCNPKLRILSTFVAKDKFYQDLNELLIRTPLHAIIMVTGDFNALIGKDSHETNQ